MPSYDELVAANAAIRKVLDAGAEAKLRAIPGVMHVSVGLKERGRAVTRTLSIRVYVREKLPEDKLSPRDRIPREIGGVPTDVNAQRTFEFAVDFTRYRPVKGGIMISNRIIGLNAAGDGTTMEAGTFGCTATRNTDGSVMLLSCWHVLMANTADIGYPIYQPAPARLPDVDLADLPLRPTDDTNVIAKISGYAITDKVDAAIARIDVSSCCRCCGIDYRDEIVGLSEDGAPASDNIVGLRAAVAGATVYKSGVTTGRTVGRVVDTISGDLVARLNGREYTFRGQIEIAGDDPLFSFSTRGDSGSAIIDEDGYIVGLLFSSLPEVPPDHRTYANHISDVCTALGITINLTMGSHPSAGARVAVPSAFADAPTPAGAELYAAARARLLADPAGAWLWALAEEHREEIVSLVTKRRPVTVAWRRAGGPALFAAALNTLRGGGETLPVPPVGGTLEASLARVGDALAAHGSPALREALAAHRAALLASVRDSSTLGEVLEKLRLAILTPA